MNGVKRFARNVSYQVMLNVSNGAIMFLFTIVAANKLGPEEFGRFSLVQVFFYMLGVISDFGMSNTLVKGIAREKEKSNYYLSNLLFIKLAFSVAGLFVVWILSAALGYSNEFRLLLLTGSSVVIPQSVVAFVGGTFNAHERMEFSTVPGMIVNMLAYGTCCVLLLIARPNLLAIFLLLLFFNMVLAFVSMRLLNRHFFRFKWELDLKSWGTLFRDAFPFFVVSSSGIVGVKIDNILLSRIKNDAQVGYYNVATRIHQIFMFFVSACNTVFFPFFSRLEKESEGRHLKAYGLSMKIMALLGFAVLVYVSLFSEDIIELFFPNYRYAVVSVIILSISTFFVFLTTVTNIVLYSMDRQRVVMWIVLFAMLANVVSNSFLIPAYGIEGASVSAVVFAFVQFVSGYAYLSMVGRKKTGFPFAFAKLFFASAVTMTAIVYLKPINILLSLIAPFALFCVLVVLTKVFDRSEIVLLKEVPLLRKIPFLRD